MNGRICQSLSRSRKAASSLLERWSYRYAVPHWLTPLPLNQLIPLTTLSLHLQQQQQLPACVYVCVRVDDYFELK